MPDLWYIFAKIELIGLVEVCVCVFGGWRHVSKDNYVRNNDGVDLKNVKDNRDGSRMQFALQCLNTEVIACNIRKLVNLWQFHRGTRWRTSKTINILRSLSPFCVTLYRVNIREDAMMMGSYSHVVVGFPGVYSVKDDVDSTKRIANGCGWKSSCVQ